jgi:hypothetical protein
MVVGTGEQRRRHVKPESTIRWSQSYWAYPPTLNKRFFDA